MKSICMQQITIMFTNKKKRRGGGGGGEGGKVELRNKRSQNSQRHPRTIDLQRSLLKKQ